VLALLGKLGISMSYCVCWMHAVEMYPTNIRFVADTYCQGCQADVEIPAQLPGKTSLKVAKLIKLVEFTANFGSETQQHIS